MKPSGAMIDAILSHVYFTRWTTVPEIIAATGATRKQVDYTLNMYDVLRDGDRIKYPNALDDY